MARLASPPSRLTMLTTEDTENTEVLTKEVTEVKATGQLLPVPPLCSLWLAVPSVV
jgi:hypothetical protein